LVAIAILAAILLPVLAGPNKSKAMRHPKNDTRAASLLVKSAISALFCEPDAI
jgi:hypothetical protein